MYILGSHSSMVHAPSGLHPHGWNPSVRSLLYRTLLHLLRDLWEPVLLPLRVPVPRVCHPGDLLLTDLDRDGLFPALRRGLSLVVEVILFFSLNLDVDLNLENFSFSDVCPPPPILKFFFLPKVILFMYKISFSNFYCAFIASIYIVICCILINLIEKNFQKLILDRSSYLEDLPCTLLRTVSSTSLLNLRLTSSFQPFFISHTQSSWLSLSGKSGLNYISHFSRKAIFIFKEKCDFYLIILI